MADRSKAFLSGNNHVVVAARAMHDLNVSVPVPARHDADVFIIRIKGEVADLCVLPADWRAVAMLHSRTAAVADNIAAARGVVKGPIHE